MTTRTTNRRRSPIAVLAAVALVVTACTGGDDPSADTSVPTTDDERVPSSDATGPDTSAPSGTPVRVGGTDGSATSGGPAFRLADGGSIARAPDPTTVVDGTPLTADEVAAVLDRLPEWDLPTDDVTDVARPVESLRPPVAERFVDASFPPPGDAPVAPDAVADGPLEVLRVQPEGEVDVAPFLAITFDEPMVPLATLEQLDAADVPVTMTPAVDGRWRWIGTRTLRFEVVPDPDGALDRLPAATEYSVTVPAGTTSVNGAELPDDVTFEFATPAPRVEQLVGVGDSMGLDPVFVATFDQRVEPAAVLDAISLDAGGVDSVRLATDAEIDADESVRRIVDASLPGRAVAFVPTATLGRDVDVTVTVGPGVPSTEGPRTGDERRIERGRTYGPLTFLRSECGFGGDCVPSAPFSFVFANPLDADAFDPSLVRVSPAPPGLRVEVGGDTLVVSGATSGRTTYTVSIDGALTDVFGQRLGETVERDIEVGAATPRLVGPEMAFVTTDPFADTPTLSFTTVNHDRLRYEAWSVTAEQYGAFVDLEQRMYDLNPPEPTWPQIVDTTVGVDAESDRFAETAIDLTAAFEASDGPIVVRVGPGTGIDRDSERWYENRPRLIWVQQSTLGVDAFPADDELLVWTTDLRTGEPVGDVTVSPVGRGSDVVTDADGLARIPLGSGPEISALVATDRTGRSAMLPSFRFDGWGERRRVDAGIWYVTDDRGLYRPGETVRMAGFVRSLEADDLQLALVGGDASVDYQAYDPVGNELTRGSVPVNRLGGFDLRVELPEESNTGIGFVEMQLVGADLRAATSHAFQVQDFRTPTFEVTTRVESAPPFLVGEPASVAVDANYFAGGPLPDAEVNWLVRSSETTFTPPNRDDFEFGIWQPWWFGGFHGGGDIDVDSFVDECFDCVGRPERFREFRARTDAAGSHVLRIEFDDTDEDGDVVDQPTSVTAEATVVDVDRQAFTSGTSLLVHPARFYVGLRSDRAFVRRGDPMRIDAIVADVDGEVVPGRRVTVEAGRVEVGRAGGVFVEEVVDVQTCEITSTDSADGVRCEFTTEVGGRYRITATVSDDDGRTNRAEYTLYVSGAAESPSRTVEQGEVTIVPDAEQYSPGDTAEVLAVAPFAPATALVTVVRAGIESTSVIDAPDGSAVVEIPVADADIPGVEVRVDMVGASARTADDGTPLPDAPQRPAYAAGQLSLAIPPVSRTLDVTATPANPVLAPGGSTSVTVRVADADGAPVADSSVVVIVVDEAVLASSGFELADPLGRFYDGRVAGLSADLIRRSIVLTSPDLLGAGGEDPFATGGVVEETAADDAAMDDGDAMESVDAAGSPGVERASAAVGAPIDVRSDFDALAVFEPSATTGADGTVTVDVELPDNLTRYRVMAVAVAGADRFGSGESTITARLPVTVRPSAPRFLNFGDRFELPLVVQNQTDGDLDVDIAVESSNLGLDASVGGTDARPRVGRRVTVPANDRVEVRVPASASEVGTARFRVATVAGGVSDAAEIALPVYTPATSEAFATYGVLDDDTPIAQPVSAPEGVVPQFGGLEISTSSTALSALTDAVLYLRDYEYESTDGYAARIMSVAALRDVLDAFDAAGLPAPAELDAAVGADVAALAALQNPDGGYPYSARSFESQAWLTVVATHALVLARESGYAVDEGTFSSSLDAVRSIERFIPSSYGPEIRAAIEAYALYVRDLAGDGDPAAALALYRGGDLQLDGVARVWPVITDESARDEIEREFRNRAVETAGAATFATDYGEDAYLVAVSDRRTDGIVLGALLSETPDSDLVPKVVDGLLGDRVRGRWGNVYENAFILLALNDYFSTFESVDPDFVARAWLGDTFAVDAEFRGRSTDTSLTVVPTADLVAAGDTNVVLDKDGPGRLYYRLGLEYAPADLALGARDEGFVVERVYEAIDDPDDVVLGEDGTWTIRAGASVRVRLTMVADARRTNVALVDPLPAGLESLNPSLAGSATIPPDESDGDGNETYRTTLPWWRWFDFQNLRDDRTEAFTTLLPGGTYEYTYVARATTPGEFVVPPTTAEEVYAPEVFGRSASDRVVVAD